VYSGALVSVPDSAVLYPGQSIEMNPRGNALYYNWFPTVGLSNPGIANPTANPSVNTLYYVTGTTEAGCTAMDSIYVMVNDETAIDMANAFSPGSEPNPIFKVSHLGTATLKSFQIFNRWGQKLFETTDINKGWDGMFNNTPQPMGVYVYRVEATTAKGKTFLKQGNVTLLR
ncbi:MAG: gliding motility-associated C-terminal domain-containing protein, partial [Bacteroidetes bacterium]|nr:gliding motility-associated C-terminal domain-containing protein [Bacteroidota bacterium]